MKQDNMHTGAVENRKMEFNFFTLKFSGSSAHLENEFITAFHAGALTQLRITLTFAILIYGFFGLLDSELLPGVKEKLWFVRYAMICPGFFTILAFTWSKFFLKYIQPLIFFAIISAGAGIMAMIVMAPPPLNYSYYAGLILVILIGYTMMRIGFLWVSAGGWTVICVYQVLMIGVLDIPTPLLIRNNFFLISSNIIGMFAAYYLEYYARIGFFTTAQLAFEREKVKQANVDLEKRVLARTSDLLDANESLKREIIEKKKVEKERAKLEGRLERAHKMEAIGTLAGGVAHDLNNILSGLVSLPELLLMDLPEDSPMARDLQTIQDSGTKAAAIVQDLLTLARRGVAVMDVTNLNLIVSEYLESYELKQMRSCHPGVRVESRLVPGLMNTVGSQVHILKTIMNLVLNGAEALKDGGKIVISTQNVHVESPLGGYEAVPAGKYAVLAVSDTGEGIAPRYFKRIFEPFFTKKEMGRSGTGLGMTIVWGTVKDHKGFLDIQSKKGVGTTFRVYFPVTGKPLPGKVFSLSVADYTGNGESILVIDDSPEQRAIASGILEKLNYGVAAVSSGEAAVEWLKERSVDLILLDMLMEPGMNGLETYGEILHIHPGQKAVIASGFSESIQVKRTLSLGAGAYVKKPYTMEDIGLAVQRGLNSLV